jgi:hypothetical protein
MYILSLRWAHQVPWRPLMVVERGGQGDGSVQHQSHIRLQFHA